MVEKQYGHNWRTVLPPTDQFLDCSRSLTRIHSTILRSSSSLYGSLLLRWNFWPNFRCPTIDSMSSFTFSFSQRLFSTPCSFKESVDRGTWGKSMLKNKKMQKGYILTSYGVICCFVHQSPTSP